MIVYFAGNLEPHRIDKTMLFLLKNRLFSYHCLSERKRTLKELEIFIKGKL